MHLIVPMAGRSSRFPNVKPKWMLTHPSGRFMVLEAIKGLNLDAFETIYFVYLQEHEEKFHFLRGFKEELEDSQWLKRTRFIALPEPTKDQPETVLQSIERAAIAGPVFIKDSDNFFSVSVPAANSVCFSDINKLGLIKATNKSYISRDSRGNVVNIMEKQVISSTFCVGGYGFKDAKDYCSALKSLPFENERYISNVIYQMLLTGQIFQSIEVEGYSDWGTIEDWDRFKRSFATLFLDLDGTIVKNSSAHFPPYVGESEPLVNNVEIIKQLQRTGKFQIIIITSRHEKYRRITQDQLSRLGLKYDHLIMGMHHSKRIIINDYAKSNPYKSCDSINLKRDTDDLTEILRESLGIDYSEL